MMKLPDYLTPRRVHTSLIVALFATVWLIIFWISAVTYDPDFGWHLMSGRYIMAHGVPARDIFSYTMSDFRWINHEWLNDVLLAQIYRLGGYNLVAAAFALLWTLAIWLAARKRLWFTTLLASIVLFPYFGIRPMVWSMLGLVLLERLMTKRTRLRYVAIVGLFLVWANLHGGFALGLGLLIAAAIVRRPVDRGLRITAVIASLATLINPYGWRVYKEILRTALDTSLHFHIAEWGFIGTYPGFWIYTILLVACFWTFELNKRRWRFCVPAILIAMTISSSRNCVLYIAVSLRYLEQYLVVAVAALTPKMRRWAYAAGVSLIGCLLIVNLPRTTSLRLAHYAPGGVAYLQAHPCSGNIFNDYDFGGYVIEELPPARTYIDGRMPSWSNNQGSIFNRYERVLVDPVYRAQQFATYNIRCVLISRSTVSAKLGKKTIPQLESSLKLQGWHEAWSDGSSLLLVQR